MRVLVIPSWYPDEENPTGGIFVLQQVRALSAQGIDVAVLFPGERYTEPRPVARVEDGILTVRTGWRPTRVKSLLAKRLMTAWRFAEVRLPRYRSQIEESLDLLRRAGFEPDVIHVHALWPAASAAVVVSKRLGIPFVVTEHSEEYTPGTDRMLVRTPGVLQLVLRPLARHAAAYIAVSKQLGKRLQELGIHGDVKVIPNVVPDRPLVTPIPPRPPHRILHVSQLGPAKNIPLLLQSVAELRRRRHDFVLEIGGDSPYRSDAERIAADLGLAGSAVCFLGRLSPEEVQMALDRAAFTVLSSKHENSSVFAAESLMSGRPLLTTACGGHVEYLSKELGHVVDNENVPALADGLDWMLNHIGDFDANTLHEFALTHFGPEVIATQLLDVYRSVLDG
jgi:glycosyltransferase involved in cell wall biosynthesis